MSVIIPDWMADKELDRGPGAYESLDPALRAVLKAQIALLHEIWLPERRESAVVTRLPGGGDSFAASSTLDWAIFVLAEGYASPAGCIAAILPALMAGVESVIICRLGNPKDPLHPALSAALELLGREEIFALSAAEAARLTEDLIAQNANGLTLVLGSEMGGAYSLPARVRIGLEEGAEPDREILAWLHPTAEVEAVKPGVTYNTVITPSADFYGAYHAPLVLGPGYNYFWRWPDLSPEFFRQKRFLLRNR